MDRYGNINTTVIGPGAREEAGLPSGGGPYRVITQLAVYGYDEDTKVMKLASLHPGPGGYIP